MTRLLILTFIVSFSASSLAITADGLMKEYVKILKHCRDVGFYICEKDKFISEGLRGPFYKPIQMQHVKIMEEKYEKFVNREVSR